MSSLKEGDVRLGGGIVTSMLGVNAPRAALEPLAGTWVVAKGRTRAVQH